MKRLIVCLDVRRGKVTKGVKFRDNVDLGDPADYAERYCDGGRPSGCDELVVYDITASAENRPIDIGMVRTVAARASVPLCVGGGLRDVEDMRLAFDAGAAKVSLNSLAVLNPDILDEGAGSFGRPRILLGMDARRLPPDADEALRAACPSGYEVVIQGGRKPMALDAVAWAREAVRRGAGEICLNAIDTDGVRGGYELEITRKVSDAVDAPVIASGGAGTIEHLASALGEGHADAALVASMVHSGDFTCLDIKRGLAARGIAVRL